MARKGAERKDARFEHTGATFERRPESGRIVSDGVSSDQAVRAGRSLKARRRHGAQPWPELRDVRAPPSLRYSAARALR
ncbi:hypothetical protein T492DRAFT_884356 [Pavlovales sp. CCMP2436]|nr:hypothetical protein T492DRAFT_884356 [Pavlovales sp. CCMP2436]